MQKTIHKILVCLAVLPFLLAACKSSKSSSTPTIAPEAVLTAAVQTASVRLTEAAKLTPSPTPTVVTSTPELALTQAFGTVAAQLTQAAALTPSPTSTSAASPTFAEGATEKALYVADVTIPDGTNFRPGTAFTKTWRIKNAGTSTWTTAYALVFISGDKMGGPDRVSLPSQVAPGNTVDISVDLVAPQEVKKYRGYWKLLNSAGRFVDDAVYVEINVVAAGEVTPTPTQGTPGANTPTPTTASGELSITDLSMSVEPTSSPGPCPQPFTFTAHFTLSKAATVSYKLEAGTETPGFTFTLPDPQTKQLSAGGQTLIFTLDITHTVKGWVRLHITAPQDLKSDQAEFTLTCP